MTSVLRAQRDWRQGWDAGPTDSCHKHHMSALGVLWHRALSPCGAAGREHNCSTAHLCFALEVCGFHQEEGQW